MSEPLSANTPTNTRKSRRRLLRWSGIAALLFGLYLSAFLVPDLLETAGGPTTFTLAQAAEAAHSERTYAQIADGAWECDTLRLVRGISVSTVRGGANIRREIRYTEVFYTDDDQQTVVFVTLSGEIECDELAGQAPTGYLYTLHDDTRRDLTNDALLARYFATETFLELCGYCGQKNSLIGAAFGVGFLLLGVGLIIASRKFKAAPA